MILHNPSNGRVLQIGREFNDVCTCSFEVSQVFLEEFYQDKLLHIYQLKIRGINDSDMVFILSFIKILKDSYSNKTPLRNKCENFLWAKH